MPAPICLQVGAVRERDLHLEEHVSVARNWLGDVLEPQVAGRVEDQRPHAGSIRNDLTTGSSTRGYACAA